MVRITHILCKVRYHKRINDAYRRKGVYKFQPTSVAAGMVHEQGKQIVDPLTYINPPPEPWTPPEDMYMPSFLNKRPERVVQNTRSMLHLSNSARFTEGINQACILTKTIHYPNLPEPIDQLVGVHDMPEQDEKIYKIIRHAFIWDNTQKQLPKRKDFTNLSWRFRREYGVPDEKSTMYLIHDLMRLAQEAAQQFPRLVTDRRVVAKPETTVQYPYNEELINVATIGELLVLGRDRLPAPGDPELVAASKEMSLPSMYPVDPIIDLERRDMEIEEEKSFLKDPSSVLCRHPQLIVRANAHHHIRLVEPYNLMTCFAAAYAEAKHIYGPDVKELPEPITILNINCTYNMFNFMVFQLNTTDTSSEEGIKNFVWTDSNNRLMLRTKPQPWKYKRRRYYPNWYTQYNKAVFQKMLAMYLYSYSSKGSNEVKPGQTMEASL